MTGCRDQGTANYLRFSLHASFTADHNRMFEEDQTIIDISGG